jgi:hypothetical protein
MNEPTPTKHSFLGKVSVGIAIFAATAAIVVQILARPHEGPKPGSMSQADPQLIMYGVLFLCVMGVCFLGGTLGMGGIFEPNRKLTLAVLGILLNILVVFVCIILMLMREGSI